MAKNLSPEYRSYIASPEWQAVRQSSLTRYGRRCAGCMDSDVVHMHHLFYPADLTMTTADHIVPLCARCHKEIHRQQLFHPTVFSGEGCGAKRIQTIRYLQSLQTARAEALRKAHEACRPKKKPTPKQQRAFEESLERNRPLYPRRKKTKIYLSYAEYQSQMLPRPQRNIWC